MVMDRYVEDGSYLRCSDITLSYVLPAKWTNKIGDCPWHLPEDEMRLIDSLSIPSSQKEAILGDNAAMLLRLAN